MKHHRSEILPFIKKNKVVMSSEVAKFLGVSWNTAESWLKDLALDGKVERIKKEGGINLWIIK